MAEALLEAGHDVRAWYDHHPGQRDVDWLPPVCTSGWVVLTKDRSIRRNPLEIAAILSANGKAFVLTATELRRERQAEIFLKAMPKIKRICLQRGPFIFNITQSGAFSRIRPRRPRRRG